MPTGKEEMKTLLFSVKMFVYVENCPKSSKKTFTTNVILAESQEKKINIKKKVIGFLYTSNEHTDIEMKIFTITHENKIGKKSNKTCT